jgi:hypothetical protein
MKSWSTIRLHSLFSRENASSSTSFPLTSWALASAANAALWFSVTSSKRRRLRKRVPATIPIT